MSGKLSSNLMRILVNRQEMTTVINLSPDEIMSKDIFVQWWTTVIDCQWQKFA